MASSIGKWAYYVHTPCALYIDHLTSKIIGGVKAQNERFAIADRRFCRTISHVITYRPITPV